MRQHLVVAENYNQARYYAEKKLKFLGPWRYISEPEQLSGLEGPLRNPDSPFVLHWTLTFYRRPNYASLREAAADRGFPT